MPEPKEEEPTVWKFVERIVNFGKPLKEYANYISAPPEQQAKIREEEKKKRIDQTKGMLDKKGEDMMIQHSPLFKMLMKKNSKDKETKR